MNKGFRFFRCGSIPVLRDDASFFLLQTAPANQGPRAAGVEPRLPPCSQSTTRRGGGMAERSPARPWCSICSEVLRNPASLSCGHNFCMDCISRLWDEEEQRSRPCSCPRCSRTFRARPALLANGLLAALVGQQRGAEQSLQQELSAIGRSADLVVEESRESLGDLARLLEDTLSDVVQQVRTQQRREVGRVEELRSRSGLWVSSLQLTYFEEVRAAVAALRGRLQDQLLEARRNISLTVTNADVFMSQPEPKTRAGLLGCWCELSLDPDTAHVYLMLSEDHREATAVHHDQGYPRVPGRFSGVSQVLSVQTLSGRCYWEVDWSGFRVGVAAAYKITERFGETDGSWALYCQEDGGYTFHHNGLESRVSGPPASRIGVYLDYEAGVLSFYSVCEVTTLLHRVRTTFSQQLYAGLWIGTSARVRDHPLI